MIAKMVSDGAINNSLSGRDTKLFHIGKSLIHTNSNNDFLYGIRLYGKNIYQ
jgi:hypothetical protein